jgi:non-lysosomal glucosylceramidase
MKFSQPFGGCLKKQSFLPVLACLFLFSSAARTHAQDEIPKAAWRRPIGLPLENSGVTRVAGDIDDGYWQGAPVGGFGSGTFSRTYRGDFARWHMKAGVHKYETVFANQFAMFQQSDGDPKGTPRVLMTGHPQGGNLSSWDWDYPTGAGEYAALYPEPGMITSGTS